MRDLNDAFIRRGSFFLALAVQFNHQVTNDEQSPAHEDPRRPSDQTKRKAIQRSPDGFEGVDDGRTHGFQVALVEVEDSKRDQGSKQAKAQQWDQDTLDPKHTNQIRCFGASARCEKRERHGQHGYGHKRREGQGHRVHPHRVPLR
ncbi:MAG: hypothetical protein CMA56_01980 [Euryarchaeota archaeon]|nr:hypothetical protein [Euryarchaeota archaeon]